MAIILAVLLIAAGVLGLAYGFKSRGGAFLGQLGAAFWVAAVCLIAALVWFYGYRPADTPGYVVWLIPLGASAFGFQVLRALIDDDRHVLPGGRVVSEAEYRRMKAAGEGPLNFDEAEDLRMYVERMVALQRQKNGGTLTADQEANARAAAESIWKDKKAGRI